jgi:hypothetical protein
MADPVDVPIVEPKRLPTRLIGSPRPDPPQTLDEKLDQALADSFPASDPVSSLVPAPQRKRDK